MWALLNKWGPVKELLTASYIDHPLKGECKVFRDAHIEPNWLLIYKIAGDVVRFERTGRCADLFDG